MSLRGNKGEWSEIYTLFKLLSKGTLEEGDEDLDKLLDGIYPIVKIVREESSGVFEYAFNSDRNLVIISNNNIELLRLPISNFARQASSLLSHIRSNNGTFAIQEIENFMTSIHCTSIKANSGAKTDIVIQIHDVNAKQSPVLGFSIKSQLGSPSTLLNAGKTTNFKYKLPEVVSDELIGEINNISTRSKVKDRLTKVVAEIGKPVFVNLNSRMFKNNLVVIDSALPEILSNIVLKFYMSDLKTLDSLVDWIEEDNPLNFDVSDGHEFYRVKVKRFLTDVALGMMPSKCWSGQHDATGGYLIVKNDGDIVCYHLYNRNVFESYLLKNTKLETASTSRYEFGQIYKSSNDLQIDLNLQIRFCQ